jgi:hypothetical protein
MTDARFMARTVLARAGPDNTINLRETTSRLSRFLTRSGRSPGVGGAIDPIAAPFGARDADPCARVARLGTMRA